MIRCEHIYGKLKGLISKCILLSPFMMLFIVCGCKSIEYVPIETTKTDSIYRNKLIHDSIIVKDSIYVMEKGDTIFQYKYRYIYKDKAVHDTTYIERTDTLRIPYSVEVKLTEWQAFKMKIGGYVVVIIIVTLVALTGRFIYRIRKKVFNS